LCDALTGDHDGQATLERLEQANLFIVPLDDVVQAIGREDYVPGSLFH